MELERLKRDPLVVLVDVLAQVLQWLQLKAVAGRAWLLVVERP